MSDDLSGPHVSAAFLCDRVLQEANGVLSFIRVIDRFTRPKPGPQLPPQPIQVMMVISLKSGGVSTGNYKLKIRVFKPNAQSPVVEMENDAFFEGGQERGVTIMTPFLILPDEEGLFWIDVLFENNRITRMPFRVIFATAPSVQGPVQPPAA